jgi:arabinan endo-1,5-alpha-L-arabinosidase
MNITSMSDARSDWRKPCLLAWITSGALLLAGLGFSGCASAPTNAGRTYTNPVYAGSMPDPSVIRHDGVYYAFGTTGRERKADGRIFTVLRSTNLVDWTELGGALVPPSADARYEYWAPEAAVREGKFYLYYSMGGVEPESFVLRVGVSQRPEGPYVDAGTVLRDCETNRFTIDPFPYRDDDGQWYLFYACNFPYASDGQHPGTGLKAAKLAADMTRLTGECRDVLRARHDWTLYESNRVMEVYGQTFNWHTIEGACVIKHAGKYYCFYSGANWQTPRYGVDYVVADHPLGPYRGAGDHARVLHGIPGKVRGPGHHSIVTGPDGKTLYFVYHAWDAGMTWRQLCVDRLEWTADGPRCVPTVSPMPAP